MGGLSSTYIEPARIIAMYQTYHVIYQLRISSPNLFVGQPNIDLTLAKTEIIYPKNVRVQVAMDFT